MDPTLLSSLVNEGFTGAYIGMYATSNHSPVKNHADFDWVCTKRSKLQHFSQRNW